MKGALQRIFCLYSGEGRNTLAFSGLAFIWSLVISSGMEFSDALFIIHIGAASLPLAYGLTAGIMLALSLLFLFALHRLGVYRTFLTLISIGILFYGTTFFCLQAQLFQLFPPFWYVLKIFGYIFFSFGLTSYWTFVDEYHHIRDAKRIYTFFTTFIFLGIAATGLLMRSGIFSLEKLLFFLLVMILCALFTTQLIRRFIPLIIHEESEQETSSSGKTFTLFALIQWIFRSRITLALLIGNLLMQLCNFLTEFNYFSAFDQSFTENEELLSYGEGTQLALTKFMGKLVLSVSLFNLFFGLFIYSRLARRFGIGALLSITPILLSFTFTGWIFHHTLLFPIIGFFVTDGTLWVIDDNNFNILLNAVPSKIKYKIRVAIESFFEPIGILISSIILYFFASISKGIGLTLSLVWIVVTLVIRSEYLKGIFQNLSDNAIHFSRSTKQWLLQMRPRERRGAEFRMLAIVKHESPEEKLLACQGLLALEDPSILEKLFSFAKEMDPSTKKVFLDQLITSAFDQHPIVLDHLQEWLREEEDENLCGSILFYFAQKGLLHPEKVLEDLASPHIYKRSAAIAALKKSGAHLSLDTLRDNRTQAIQRLQQLLTSSNSHEVCMGIRILMIDATPNEVDLLIPYLKHLDSIIVRTASQAIAMAMDKTCRRQAPILLELLEHSEDPDTRIACIEALGKLEDSAYARAMILASIPLRPRERRALESVVLQMGLKTVPMLLLLIDDTSLGDRCRLLAAQILGALSLPQLRARIQPLVQKEVERAFFYLYHAQTIQKRYRQHDLHVLVDALETGYQSTMDFIIQLLAITGEVEDRELLARSLRSRNPKIRNQAVEAIERSCDPAVFRYLQVLVEDIPLSIKLQEFTKEGYKSLQLEELLDKLDHSSAPADQIIAATFKYELKLPGWKESLRNRMMSKNELFHHFAYELLEE